MEKLVSRFKIDNTYLSLDNKMYSKIAINNQYNAQIEIINEELVKDLNLDIDYLRSEDGLRLLSGSKNSEISTGYAQAYSGHQFGHFTNLGDGRALVLGEHVTSKGRFDIQLKGSGPTPYSRRGDGKATLSSMLREHLISEAIHHLNIPSSRSLCVIKTNEKVLREVINDGAILVRVSKSHIRVGTFEYAYSNLEYSEVKKLTDYTINRHYSFLNNVDDKYYKFLLKVIENQASLIAKWQSVGFIHGVLNTDNVLISGDTIDYGPCAFMDEYNPKAVFSSIDKQGRYAYLNQPYIGSWNMARFAEILLPLLSEDKEKGLELANKALEDFGVKFHHYWVKNMAAKIGIKNVVTSDKSLIQELLNIMESKSLDFTNTFRMLTLRDFSKINIIDSKELLEWISKWEKRLNSEGITIEEAVELMKKNNPNVIPRNHLVEEALSNVTNNNDNKLFSELLLLLKNPYDYSIKYENKFTSPGPTEVKHVTYCGT